MIKELINFLNCILYKEIEFQIYILSHIYKLMILSHITIY